MKDTTQTDSDRHNLDRMGNIGLEVIAELGRKELTLRDVRQLAKGDVVALGRLAGEAFDLLLDGRLFGRGETVVIRDRMAVRLTSMIDREEATP